MLKANLAGLFHPIEDEIWNEDILWQPIPVHTVQRNLDHVLAVGKPCANYTAAYNTYVKESLEVQRMHREYTHLLKYWPEMSGANISTIPEVQWLYNTLEIEHHHNKTLINAIRFI